MKSGEVDNILAKLKKNSKNGKEEKKAYDRYSSVFFLMSGGPNAKRK